MTEFIVPVLLEQWIKAMHDKSLSKYQREEFKHKLLDMVDYIEKEVRKYDFMYIKKKKGK